eukprot:749858-Hanusia_phi.AAC.8
MRSRLALCSSKPPRAVPTAWISSTPDQRCCVPTTPPTWSRWGRRDEVEEGEAVTSSQILQFMIGNDDTVQSVHWRRNTSSERLGSGG